MHVFKCQAVVVYVHVSSYAIHSVSQDGILQPAVLREVLCQPDVLDQIIDVPEGTAVCCWCVCVFAHVMCMTNCVIMHNVLL